MGGGVDISAAFGGEIRIPDFWQAEALRHLRAGRDLVLHAPTGAGKTFVFEMFFSDNFKGRAVYTVPTRALANDKYSQWKSEGWRVGIATGDYSMDTNSPLVVATLETQKSRLFSGDCPNLLVIDEYQLLADSLRGANYELSIALAPAGTQLLLMSGSVENTADILAWLKRIGRDAALVSHNERAVPLEEIMTTALPEVRARGLRGMWSRLVQRIIEADMSPVLIFAPRRAEAESIARMLVSELPCDDFLVLPRELSESAGKELARMMRRRVAFHHSGLSARQRAEVVEKYARSGDLKVVVATTGLGAGVNFSMRSVLITDREYDVGGKPAALRADEILQMYGRAGRRGKDKIGYAICMPARPRLSEARAAILKRIDVADSPSILRIMARAVDEKKSPVAAAENFCKRLFCEGGIDLGFDSARAGGDKSALGNVAEDVVEKREILNSKNLWERKKPFDITPISEVLFYDGEAWVEFVRSARAVASLKRGDVCKIGGGRYGLMIDIAVLSDIDGELGWRLARQFGKEVKSCRQRGEFRNFFAEKILSLKNIKRNVGRFIEIIYAGAKCIGFEEKNLRLRAKLDVGMSKVKATVDSYSARLYNPPERVLEARGENDFAKLSGLGKERAGGLGTAVEMWLKLGLIDASYRPTLRGRVFSLFNGGEGLAIAAALEDDSYDVRAIAFDIANLRAGHRFAAASKSLSSRLADVCRLAYSMCNIRGYLNAGVPLAYGDGASEAMARLKGGASFSSLECDLLKRGDIERAYLEWQSLMRHIAGCPDLHSSRWAELQLVCRELVG